MKKNLSGLIPLGVIAVIGFILMAIFVYGNIRESRRKARCEARREAERKVDRSRQRAHRKALLKVERLLKAKHKQAIEREQAIERRQEAYRRAELMAELQRAVECRTNLEAIHKQAVECEQTAEHEKLECEAEHNNRSSSIDERVDKNSGMVFNVAVDEHVNKNELEC